MFKQEVFMKYFIKGSIKWVKSQGLEFRNPLSVEKREEKH